MPAAIRYDDNLSQYCFETPSPVRPRELFYDEPALEQEDRDALDALRTLEDDGVRPRTVINVPLQGDPLVPNPEVVDLSDSESEIDDNDCIITAELSAAQVAERAMWKCIRAAPSDDIHRVIDICYEILAERDMSLRLPEQFGDY